MPWQTTSTLEQRIKFVREIETSEESFSTICAQYHVSRVTGYKWWQRYQERGQEGLLELSRAPHRVEHGLQNVIKELILEGRRLHPSWGPRKLLAWLKIKYPRQAWCAASTVGELLRREGLSVARVYRRRCAPRLEPLEPCERPNQVWCTDFKGWFYLGNGRRCEPWTLSDGYSRYLLRVEALARPRLSLVQRGFEGAFGEYGLPEVIRNDNGRPFAGLGLGGLSKLSVWWIKLGIRPERIRPGNPQENGRHERMHLTLLEAIRPPAINLRAQQGCFQAFQQEFNTERPHEALGQQTPASVYQPSLRPYPARLPKVEYEGGVVVKRVHAHGDINWNGHRLFVSEALGGEDVGFELIDDGIWLVRFGTTRLGTLDEKRRKLREMKATERKY
jgi:transposase InsO family protein